MARFTPRRLCVVTLTRHFIPVFLLVAPFLAASSSSAEPTGRVQDGLVLLYDFAEGAGAIVHDVSTGASPMNLTIEDPSRVTWLSEGGVRIDQPTIIPIGGSLYEVHADVLVDTAEEFQAYDLTISWDPTALSLSSLSPHAEFDDDSQFALPVTTLAGLGSTTPVVDLRHGPSATGTTRVASVVFIAPAGLPGWISVSGTVSAPDGTLIEIGPSDPVNVP